MYPENPRSASYNTQRSRLAAPPDPINIIIVSSRMVLNKKQDANLLFRSSLLTRKANAMGRLLNRVESEHLIFILIIYNIVLSLAGKSLSDHVQCAC